MALQVYTFLFVFFLLLWLARLGRHCWLPLQPSHFKARAVRTTLQRLLKPRCPDDCPACRLASTASSGVEPASSPVQPWREVKSRRGAPKRVNTEGFACPNPQCRYCGITDAHMHALVGDGKHGRAERIQTFRCQACRTTFSARRHTPLYRLKTPSQQVAMVLSALAEGLDPSAAERVFGYRQATITTWLSRAARACADLARAFLSGPASAISPVG
jgi:transposase-like protein